MHSQLALSSRKPGASKFDRASLAQAAQASRKQTFAQASRKQTSAQASRNLKYL